MLFILFVTEIILFLEKILGEGYPPLRGGARRAGEAYSPLKKSSKLFLLVKDCKIFLFSKTKISPQPCKCNPKSSCCFSRGKSSMLII